MGKKNQNKKHKFKHVESSRVGVPSLESVAASGKPARPIGNIPSYAKPAVAVAARDFSYVTADLRRIMLSAVALVSFELLLWVLLSQTPLGDVVYRLVKV